MDKGLIQVYTGDGKGKTTAALGLGLRAVGYGYKVKMIQFLKGRDSGELFSTKNFNGDFEIYRFDKSKKFFWNMNEAEKEELKKKISNAFEFIEEIIKKNDCDILILDEIMGVISNKLVSIDRVLHILDIKPENMEIILTGRNVPEAILDRADLVSEMKMVKHPFEKGISARKGIEY
ncbi:cob(I)yrinic acid a c-diamide adenosyltransferase [Caloranaerobacter sp. TR13]|uniref:cob(I)yrinic acid a,c-diamide adenosyltransferase n=1 Tax=Caloranaerobacter sp. TR13 TaxID=1302151 RepID=UPI0006D488E6|nr:cob(I)yrinic acid a,c-diamide adenosyltransferase [Caloranaerobacter sp. TR13]KPU27084.1 cob(I)yrinic acid a c-diamide adenosyltransferase [Caloranaerobacter sp. TR13]